ncbi:hypothetical protein ACFYU9_02835 [Streptomyces sp. NPDC004327]|uniref:hypothetical protein n=1 Tax=unclassified Streptomyces TaxID=2593676 RepID=UPI0036CDE5E6
MAKKDKRQAVPPEKAKETRVLGLQGLQTGEPVSGIAGFHSTQSIGCSSISIGCPGGGGTTMQQ